jgi:t-SNARE complex subunit (syntaxin)
MQNKLSTLEFNYTKEINRTIDTYTDKALTLKQDLINDITKLQNNLILNDKEKQTAINTAKDKFLENKRAYEDNMYKESEKLRDKALEQTKLLQEQMQLQEKNAIDK